MNKTERSSSQVPHRNEGGPRVLFVASLHHPEQLLRESRESAKGTPRLFPSSMQQHAWENVMRQSGYQLDVFWRNLPGYGNRDISRLRTAVYQDHLTPAKLASALLHRLPPQLNPDYLRRNQLLLEQARQFRPEIIWLSGDNRSILPQTLLQLKQEHDCKIIYVSGVSPIVFSHAIERQAARLYDLVLVNDYYHGIQWLELGAKKMECLPYVAIDPDFHYPRPRTNLTNDTLCDVGFVGTLVPHTLYGERVAALESLRDFDLGVWSMHEIPQSLKPFHRGSALGQEMLKVLSSVKISINVHGDFMRYGGNMRLFETAAIGTFQIVDDRPGIAEWFTVGEHLVTFSDLQDLQDKVAYYLSHDEERQRIADNARRHVLQNHRYDQRLKQVEELMAEL